MEHRIVTEFDVAELNTPEPVNEARTSETDMDGSGTADLVDFASFALLFGS